MNYQNFIVATSVIFLLFSKTVFATPNVANNPAKKEPPTRITSDIIDIKRKSQLMEFIGHVVVKKGPDSMISERMLVFYEDDKKSEMKSFGGVGPQPKTAQKSAIKRIESKTDVKIFSADMIATGDSGYYDPQENVFVLQNNVVVNNGSSIGHGDKFVYNLQTQKGNFIGNKTEERLSGGDKRVTFVISNDDLKNGDKKKGSQKIKNEPKQENDE